MTAFPVSLVSLFCPHVAAVNRDLSLMVNNPDIPYEYIRDTVVMQFGTFNQDPVNPAFDLFDVPQIIWRGDSIEVRELRENLDCSSDS